MKENYKEIIEEEWKKFQENKKYPNIVLLGCTGSGKSSLINDIFENNIAEINDIRPETKDFKLYLGKEMGKNINLIDSKGYELSNSYNLYVESLKQQVKELKKSGDKIHLVWFCLAVTKKRIEEIDIKTLEEVLKIEDFRKRICVVITKCDEDDINGSIAKSYKKIINDIFDDIKIFEVTTNKKIDIPELKKEKEEMLKWSANKLETEELKESFISAQMGSLELKKDKAEKIISDAMVKAGIIGISPIPFSDAIILAPLQANMILKIINVYNLDGVFSKLGMIGELVLNKVGKNLAQNIFKSIIGNALKFIPLIGSYAGGIINASVASSLTYALGKGISEISYFNCTKILKGENVDIIEIFSENAIMDEVEKYLKK